MGSLGSKTRPAEVRMFQHPAPVLEVRGRRISPKLKVSAREVHVMARIQPLPPPGALHQSVDDKTNCTTTRVLSIRHGETEVDDGKADLRLASNGVLNRDDDESKALRGNNY